jgi:thioredoxin reductase (NADPH)
VIPPAQLESAVVWALAALVAIVVVLPYAIVFHRRRRADRSRLDEARALGIDRPVAQYPFVDPASCIGCGACVKACPEGDVLGVVGGVAVVINGLRCVGHGRCADACPVGAIEVGLGDVKGRRDVPILSDDLETTAAGVFVAGELTGLALIRNAIEQGQAVIRTIAARLRSASRGPSDGAVSSARARPGSPPGSRPGSRVSRRWSSIRDAASAERSSTFRVARWS